MLSCLHDLQPINHWNDQVIRERVRFRKSLQRPSLSSRLPPAHGLAPQRAPVVSDTVTVDVGG